MNKSDSIRTLPGVGWHHEDVKAEIRKRYGSLAAFARQFELSRQSVSGALTNPLASIRIEKMVAGALNVPPHSIWPNRWQVDGKPVPRKTRLQHRDENQTKMNNRDVA